jgi:hypothetical protein
MREITEKEYLDFVEKNKFVEIGKEKISLEPIKVERFEPKDEEMTATDTTVWSFPKRGGWATHRGKLCYITMADFVHLHLHTQYSLLSWTFTKA